MIGGLGVVVPHWTNHTVSCVSVALNIQENKIDFPYLENVHFWLIIKGIPNKTI